MRHKWNERTDVSLSKSFIWTFFTPFGIHIIGRFSIIKIFGCIKNWFFFILPFSFWLQLARNKNIYKLIHTILRGVGCEMVQNENRKFLIQFARALVFYHIEMAWAKRLTGCKYNFSHTILTRWFSASWRKQQQRW